MEVKFYLVFITALFPLIVGAIWYSNALFGKTWMRVSGMTEEKVQSGNMALIFGLTYVLGVFLSGAMLTWSIHQFSTESLFATQPGFAEGTGIYFEFIQEFHQKFGSLHRSFGHGAVHGVVGTLFIVLPVIAINSLFERRGWKYVMVHTGYWLVTLILICGVLCQFA